MIDETDVPPDDLALFRSLSKFGQTLVRLDVFAFGWPIARKTMLCAVEAEAKVRAEGKRFLTDGSLGSLQ